MNTVPLTADSLHLTELFALAFQKMMYKKQELYIPIGECDKVFLQAAEFLLETDEAKPRGKVLAIKELRKLAQKTQRVGIQCANKAFVACFPDAHVCKGDDEVIELLLPERSFLGWRDAKDIIDAFLAALTVTQKS